MQHLVSYITSLWLNNFVVVADAPLRSPTPPPLFFPFVICTPYEELWQCCVFTDWHLVTCSCTVTCWQSLRFFVIHGSMCWSSEQWWKSEEPFFFNDRFCISCLKFLWLNLVNRSHKRVRSWLHFFAFCIHWQLTQSETQKYSIVAYICSKQFDIVSVGIIALLKVVPLACHNFVSHKTWTEYERIPADVLCVQLIIEFSFPYYLNFWAFPCHARGIICDPVVILCP